MDPSKVRQLSDMGFPDDRARKVLKHFRNDIDLAMDYLINTPSDHDTHLGQGAVSHINQSSAGLLSERRGFTAASRARVSRRRRGLCSESDSKQP